ncbi:hypothetical protein [Streptomyces sp. NPDC020983]|uniref:hypothetical protein n=1 Tax=Streptomyces sp. NPDC020983 TaxID=3365106 RepID=UPI00378DD6A0
MAGGAGIRGAVAGRPGACGAEDERRGPRTAGGTGRGLGGGARRAAGALAVGALLVLGPLHAGPARADSGTPAAPGTPATWQPQGTRLAGAATTADAPAMTPGVTYRDTIAPGETRFYGLALDATSSAYASAFALPAPGGRVAFDDGIELTLLSADGDHCDQASAHFGTDDGVRPVGTAVSRTIAGDGSCQEANQYTLSVHRTSDGASDPAPWTLELRSVLEPPLRAGASVGHAPGTDPDDAATPTPLTVGTPRPAAGGTSPETAAAVRTGIWKDRVLPGETRFYEIPVDWGQQATVFADFSNAEVTDDSDFTSGGVRLAVLNPVRALVDDSDHSYDGTPTSLHEQLAPVSYANRTADDSEVSAVRFAGWYYLAVTVHPDVATFVRGAVPVTLRVQVSGGAQSPPPYSGDPRAAGIGIDAHDVSSADGTARSPAAGGSVSARRFVGFAALGAGTVLVLALGVWTIVARRRPAAADTVTQLPPQRR